MNMGLVRRRFGAADGVAFSAFILAATAITLWALSAALSDESARRETARFLDDVTGQQHLLGAAGALGALSGFLILPLFLGLYQALRHRGEDALRVALLFGGMAAVLRVTAKAFAAGMAGYIVPEWPHVTDSATRARLLTDARLLQWGSDATNSAFLVALAVATIAASLVMLRLGQRWWQAVGWIGIAGSVAGVLGAFELVAEGLGVAANISGALAIIWLLGVGIGLWRESAVASAASASAVPATGPSR